MRKFIACKFLITGAALLVAPVFAGALTYSTSTAWNAAGPVDGTVTFTDLTPGGYVSPLTVPPFVFTALVGSTLGITNAFGPGTGNFIYTLKAMQISPVATGAIFGLGFNIRCYSSGCGSAESIIVTDVGNNSFTYSGVSLPGFWGVRSDLAIANIRITFPTTSDTVAIDDVSFGSDATGGGTPADTPEAATLILIGTGLGLIARYRRYSSNLAVA
jgi:hypothetical protein